MARPYHSGDHVQIPRAPSSTGASSPLGSFRFNGLFRTWVKETQLYGAEGSQSLSELAPVNRPSCGV